MSGKFTKRTVTRVLSKLRKGLSLRQIAAEVGLSNQQVWRIGDANGVYSVRSGRDD
jgi:phosphoserine phosphatase